MRTSTASARRSPPAARRTRRTAGADPLREQDEEGHARAAGREEREQVQRCRVGVVEILEHVEERTGAGERTEDVEDDEIHPSLPLLRLARRLLGAGQM